MNGTDRIHVVLTTSEAEKDVIESYDPGVNAYVTKPVTCEGLVHTLPTLGDFWFELVRSPSERHVQHD